MRSITIESIEKFIFEGKIESAIDYMIIVTNDLISNDELLHSLTLLKSRLSTISKNHHKGITKLEDYNVERLKITESIIECKKDIENGILDKPLNEKIRDAELELLIYTNTYASTIKDVEMLGKTFHSEIKEETIKNSNQIFDMDHLDLEYVIESIEILEIGEEFATANVVQITKDKTPSFFRNNKLKASHTFLKEDERWKFYYSIIQEIIYF